MHTLLDDYITGMGFVGIEPGVLYHLAPVTQGIETVLSGTGSVALENVVGDWVELSLHGRSDQQTTPGAQLFIGGKDKLSYSADDSVGLTTTYDPKTGWFHVTGALTGASPTFWREENLFNMKAGVQYYFSVETVGENDNVALAESGVRNAFPRKNMSVIQQVDTNANQIYANSSYEVGTEFDLKFRIMITIGDSSLSWEPYTGNQPSPNPDYTQEIKTAGEKTAQIFKASESSATIAGISYSNGANGGISVSGTATGSGMRTNPYFTENKVVLPAGTYTLCGYCENGDSLEFGLETPSAEVIGGIAKANTPTKYNFQEDTEVVAFVQVKKDQSANEEVFIMLCAGDTALPWEPYGYKIETTLDNAGYLEKGSRSDLVKKIELKKGHKYRLFSTDKNSNKNTFVFSDPNLTFTNGNALYSYGINKGYTTNNTSGIVSEECKLYTGWNPAIEFTVTEDGLYLYYGLNSSGLSDDEVWVWTGDGYLTDTPYREQAITTYTPNGLPGIPVSSGGNYTDETGQQWITDEIDFWRGKYIQRVAIMSIAGVNLIEKYESKQYGAYVNTNKTGFVKNPTQTLAISNMYIGVSHNDRTEQTNSFRTYIDSWGRLVIRFPAGDNRTLEEIKTAVDEQKPYFLCALDTPVETDLPAEEIEAYKALRTYKPATIITANGGEVEPGITATYKKGE